MNRFIRRMNTRKLKKIAKLSGISAVIILFGILLCPLLTFIAKIVFAYMCLHVLLRLWIEGLGD
jgi:hypothetical protein